MYQPSTVLIVSETPSSAIEPLGAIKRARLAGARSTKRAISVMSSRAYDRPNSVHMTGHEMPAEFVAEFQWALKIKLRPLPPAAGGRDA